MSSIPKLYLQSGETLVVEPGGMLAYKNCSMKTHLAAGTIWERLKEYAIGGELLWRNSFTAEEGGGWVALEEQIPGQVRSEELSPEKPALMIRSGAYLASTGNVEFETKYLGFSGYFSGKGIAVLRAQVPEGKGRVFFHTSGCGVREIPISSQDGPIIIDNEMILAYSENLQCRLKNPGESTSSFLFSGEGLVCEFNGDGVVYVASGTQIGQNNIAGEILLYLASKSTYLALGALTGLGIYYYTDGSPVRFLVHKIFSRFIPWI